MTLPIDERDRQSVLRDLESPDEEVRRLAVERVPAALPVPEAIACMVERLGDGSWRVRKAAVSRLVAHSDTAQAVEALVGALGDGENPGRRNAAVEALVECGGRAVPHLVEARAIEDSDVRKLVVDTLAGIGDADAAPALIELLRDPDPNVRAASADALGAVGGEEVGAPLLAAATCESEDPLVRFSALHALGALETPLRARDLGSVLEDSVLRPAALSILGVCDDEEAAFVLLKGLESHSRSSREAAMRSLLRLLSRCDGARSEELVERIRATVASSPTLAPSAVERLGEADLPVRMVLVQFLGILGVEDAVVPVLMAGRDEALAQVSLGALDALGELAESVIDTSWDDLDTQSRRDACVFFGQASGARSGARLLTAVEDAHPELRVAAALSIGQRRLAAGLPLLVRRLAATAAEDDFESEEEVAALTAALIAVAKPGESAEAQPEVTDHAIELLSRSLDGSSGSVRLAVARVLGRIGRREDVQVVTFLLKDPSARVRREAVHALARLEPGTAAEPLRLALADEAPEVRIAAAVALGSSESDEVVRDLMRLAEDDDPRVRAAAVHSVGLRFAASDRGDLAESARRLLDGALEDEAAVALAAVSALRRVGGDAALGVGAALSRSEPEILQEVIRCIGAHGGADLVERLLPLVSHPDWSVRAEAIQTLGDRGAAKAVPPILRRLETEQDEFVRSAILRALRRLEG